MGQASIGQAWLALAPTLLAIAAALLLVALGFARRGTARLLPAAAALGALATLLPLAAAGTFPLQLDGPAAIPLLSTFLLAGSAAVPPLAAGITALALLAGSGITVLAAAGPPVLLAPLLTLAATALAVLLLRTSPTNGGMPGSMPGSTLGGILATALAARLLLDASPLPGWSGVPLLLVGTLAALRSARRAACATSFRPAMLNLFGTACALALAGIGAALLARGADLLQAAALARSGAAGFLLAGSAATALLAAAAPFFPDDLRNGGHGLRGAPLPALATLFALLSLAAVPFTPGFAAAWLLAEGLLGAGRGGGIPVLLLVAGFASALGLASAIQALAALRLAGLLLLGAPRSKEAAAARIPSRPRAAALATLAGLAALSGIVPGLLPWAEAQAGIAPPRTLLVLGAALVVLAAAIRLSRTPATVVTPWNGGFALDGVGRFNLLPLRFPFPDRPAPAAAALCALLLALAALLGALAR